MNFDVLKKVANGLNSLNCNWAIGGSLMLYFHNIVSSPNDIDILISAKDVDKAKGFLDTIGADLNLPYKDSFKTERFCGYDVDGTTIELIGDFKVVTSTGIYEFILDESAITKEISLDNIKVPTTSLEDWFVAYSVMNDPKGRIPLLKEYFSKFGSKHKNLLERSLNQNIPEDIKVEIRNILNKY